MTRKRLAILLVLLTAIGSWTFLRWPELRLESELRSARNALRVRDAESALRHLKAAHALDPKRGEIYLLQARAFRRIGHFEDVRQALRQAQRVGVTRSLIEREESLALAQSGQMQLAVPRLSGLLTNPGDDGADICEAYVNGFFIAFRFTEAFELLDAWEKDFPKDSQPHMFRGVFHETNSNPQEAVASFQKAWQLAPERTDARLRLAQALLSLKKVREALSHLRELIAKHPDDPAIQLEFGRALMESGEPEQARQILEPLAARQPDNVDLLTVLGHLELSAQQPSAALTYLEKAVAARPHDSEVRFLWGNALQRTGRVDEAKPHFEFVAKAQEVSARRQQLRAKIQANTRDIAARYEMAELAKEFSPPNDRVMWLQSIVELDPKQRRAHELLAEIHQSRGALELSAKHRGIAESLPAEHHDN